MTLRVVGAGLGRTGTHSLKVALEQLLGAPCYHMLEVLQHPESVGVWQDAVDGKPVDWNALTDGYAAAVDWPVVAFWPELADAFPDAIVVLSTRSSAQAWWKSANETIFAVTRRGVDADANPDMRAQMHMIEGLFDRFTPAWNADDGGEAARRAYDEHNAHVRATVSAARLVEWQPGDGWEPICLALELPVPAEPFPHVNTTDEFRMMVGLD
jgi:sulfotransferase family protein